MTEQSNEERAWLESRSPVMARVLMLTHEVAATDTTVLLTGETGTGKEVLARHLHAASRRAHRTFLAVNCGALPMHLAESELFGHEKGAFSGAGERRQGHFETADGGTLVLDEVSELALPLQTRLLRVLQEREVQRVGSSKTISVDVRLVATTNRDLRAMVAAGEFRGPFLSPERVPAGGAAAARSRMEDLPELARYPRSPRPAARVGRRLTPEALVRLARHDWPGNVRELGNVLERATIWRGPSTASSRPTPSSSTTTAATAAAPEPTCCRSRRTAGSAARPRSLEQERPEHPRGAHALRRQRTAARRSASASAHCGTGSATTATRAWP
ncbi:MAG: sigma 54-interacting transcriptional regulator [Myxococcota bacterium]